MTITRTLVAALATAALAAPAASAQPPDMHASVAQAAAKAQSRQDLRSPDARDAATRPRDTAVTAREQDLRHLGAGGDSAQRPLPAPPTWPAHPQSITPAPAVEAPDDGNGIDWTTIALGIAGSLLAVSGIAALTGRSRRLQRQRVTA